MSNVWFSADLHIGHKRILEFCSETRRGNTVDEHDEFLIEAWNSVVKPGDVCYILGDECLGDRKIGYNKIRRMNGAKHLIRGNHTNINEEQKSIFQEVRDYKEIRIDTIKVCMFHFPMYEWHDCHKGSFHLFGHVHADYKTVRGKSLNVGIDQRPNRDMKPFSWDDVVDYMKDKPLIEHH